MKNSSDRKMEKKVFPMFSRHICEWRRENLKQEFFNCESMNFHFKTVPKIPHFLQMYVITA